MIRTQAPFVYLDSMVFIYFAEGSDTTRPPARQLIEELRTRPGAAITSELSLAEVLAPPNNIGRPADSDRKEPMPLHIKRRLYLDLMVWSRFLELAPITRGVLYETADLRKVRAHKLPDAIHVVTAIRHQCRFMVSADRKMHVPADMTKVSPDEAGVTQLLEFLS